MFGPLPAKHDNISANTTYTGLWTGRDSDSKANCQFQMTISAPILSSLTRKSPSYSHPRKKDFRRNLSLMIIHSVPITQPKIPRIPL